MQASKKFCQNCREPMNGGVYRSSHVCPHCQFEHESSNRRARTKQRHLAKVTPPAETSPSEMETQVAQEVPAKQAEPTPAAMPLPEVEMQEAANEMPGEQAEPTPITTSLQEVETQVAKKAPLEEVKPTPATTPLPEVEAAKEMPAEQVEPTLAAMPLPETKTHTAKEEPAERIKPASAAAEPVSAVVLSTKSTREHNVVALINDIASECTLKIKMTPDLISDGKFIGGKSEKFKAALTQGKKHALAQLRQLAQKHNANLVTDVTVKSSVKKADQQTLNIIVRATGFASVAEFEMEPSEF